MVSTAHLVLVASVAAATLILAARASATPSTVAAPTILTIADAEKEEAAEAKADDGDTAEDGATDSGLFANNRVQIKDSRIVLTASDRKQLLASIAKTLAADQSSATIASKTPSLLALSRDAFLYLKPDGVVRLGWRYPLATWQLYKQYMVTETCEVKRVVGDFYYC